MEKLRKIFVMLFVVMISLVGFTACGDPYKDMRLTIDNGAEGALSKTIVYDEDDEVEDVFNITANVSGVGGSVDKGVIFTSQDTNIIVLDGNPNVDGGNTTQKFRIITTGETVITVSTKEGNLYENVSVNVIAYADRISLIHENDSRNSLPIIKGKQTDLTKIASNKGQSFINFTPAYATERNVEYEVFADASGMIKIDASADTYSVNGNNITFNKDYSIGSVYLRAVYKDAVGSMGAIKTGYTKVTLLDPINIADYKLMYSYAKDNTADGSNVIELIDIDKNITGETDYQIFLADQYAGDADNDAKNIFLVKTNAGINPTFASVLDTTASLSFTKVDKSTSNHVYSYSSNIMGKVNEYGNPITKPGFIICNGSGEGNNDILYFNINYNGFEEYFDGIEISVKVTIDAFPAGVVIDLDDSIVNNYWFDQNRYINVYNNYVNMLGTSFYVKVLNNAYETVTSQYAYVGVMGFVRGNEFVHVNELEYGESNEVAKSFSTSADSYFTIYDAKGNIVTPYTKVKSGSQLFIKYNPQSMPDFFNDADFVLYARSILDPTITTFNLATNEDGSLNKDENTNETFFYNTLNEMILNYTVNLTDIEIYAGTTDPVKIEVKNAVGLPYPNLDNVPSVKDDLEYILNGNGIVGWVTVPGLEKEFDVINGCYKIKLLSDDNRKVGTATLTVIAPNGHYDTIDINVTINPIAAEDTAKLLVGNITLNNTDTQTLQMNVGASVDVSVLFDGVIYEGGMLPYGFRLAWISGGHLVNYNNNRLIAGGTPTNANSYETHKFQLFYKTQQLGEYIINIQVFRPVNYITRSHANVDLFYGGSVENISDKAVGNVEIDKEYTNEKHQQTKYININDRTKSVVTFEANPNNSTLSLDNAKLEIGYNNDWKEVALGSLQGGFYGDPAGRDDPDYYFKPSYYPNPSFEFGNEEDESSKRKIQIGSLRVSLETIDDKNCIRVYIENVGYQSWNYATGYINDYSDLNFKIRLTYTQEHDLVLSKRYYLGGGYNGSFKTDSFYLYTDINNPETSRVTYAGGYKFVSAFQSEEIDGESGSFLDGEITKISLGGVVFNIVRDGINEVWFFDYNKYKIELPTTVSYSVKAPVTTNKIEFGGVDALGQSKYLKTLNKNQLHEKYAFEFTYSAMPERTEIPGLLFRYDYYDSVEGRLKTEHISQLYYQNLTDGSYTRTPDDANEYRVVGAITTVSYTEANGLLIYVNYITKRIHAVITCDPYLLETNPTLEGYDPLEDPSNPIDKFIELMNKTVMNNGKNNRIDLLFISVDSYEKTPVYATLQFELRTGSYDNPYTISTIEEFDNIRNDLDSSYQLISDLDFKDVNTWTPINGFKGNLFSGTYNDANSYCYKIKNFRVDLSTLDGLGGIFGSAEGVSFQNIVFENFYISYDADESEPSDGSIHVGFLVGKATECTIKNCTFTDSDANYDRYDVSSISTPVEHGLHIQDSSKSLIYYVGGVFGSFSVVNNTDPSINGIDISMTIYNDVTANYSSMYIGGFIGRGNINMSDSSTSSIKTVIYANTGKVESVGGMIGSVTIAPTTIENVNITSYIVGMNNVGGVIGQGSSSIKINNSTFTGYLQGNQNLGGFVGYSAADVEFNYSKVQFTYRDVANMKYRSSIVGDNNIGGLVGFANAKFIANYSSVMSYVDYSVNKYSVLNRMDATTESTHTEIEKANNYYGDMTVLPSLTDVYMGGFVAIANSSVEINRGYYNAHSTVYSNAKVYFGGLVGIFQNGDSLVKNGGLTITYTAVNGDIRYKQDSGSIIGGFVGIIKNGLSLHSYNIEHNYSTYPTREGVQTDSDSLSIDDYNIRNSYTLLKNSKLGVLELNPVKNFAGLNEEVDTEAYSKKLFRIYLAYRDNNLEGNRIFTLRYETPNETRFDTFAFKTGSTSIRPDGNGYLNLAIDFGSSLIKDDANFGTINAGSSNAIFVLTWNTSGSNRILNIKFNTKATGSMSTYAEIYSYAPKKTVYTVPNVLALNSFYQDFETDVRIFNGSGYTTHFVTHKFVESNIGEQEIVVGDYTFDYFTQRSKYTYDSEVYYSTYDNLKHKAQAIGGNKVELNVSYSSIIGGNDNYQLYPYSEHSQYVKYCHTQHVDASRLDSINQSITASGIASFEYNSETDGVLPADINETHKSGGSTINDKSITSVSSIYVNEYYQVKMDNHAFVVTSGTSLNGKTNRDVYDPNRDAIADPLNPVRYADRYKWYINVSSDKDQIINGLPIPFQSYLQPKNLIEFLDSGVPLLVVDVPSREINSISDNYYLDTQNSNNVFMLTYYGVDANGVSDSRNSVTIEDVLVISTIPELANEQIIYTSNNLSVLRIVDNEKLLLLGEGNAIVKATSALSGLSLEFKVVVIAYDHHEKYWEITTMNNPLTATGDKEYETFIPIDSGDVINFDNGYRGKNIFGVRFEFNTSDITINEIGRTVEDFLRTLNISGHLAIYSISGSNVVIEIDGLTHAISCNILGSVEIKQTLYLKYKYESTIYTYDIDTKTITYSFVEAVYGITGADEFNIYTLDTHSFSVVINCDSEAPKLNLIASIIGNDDGRTIRFNDIKNNQVFKFSEYSLGYLTVEVVSISYDQFNKLKTYTFRVSVDESQQTLIQNEYEYNFRFVVDNEPDFYHDVKIGLKPQNVESIYTNHYTNVFFTANSLTEVPEGARDSYKYPSDIIIPGYTSLLQVNLYPYFGRFDYISIESDTIGIVIGQVVEVYNSANHGDSEKEYSWYEYYSNGQTVVPGVNGITTVAKTSYKDAAVDPSTQMGYNGTLFFALSADTKLSSHQVNIIIKGYINNNSEPMFSDSVVLKVEARPTIIISGETREIMFGESVDIDIETINVDSDFEASLKVNGVNNEYIDVLGSIIKDGSKYKFTLNDSTYVYTIFHQYMFKEIILKVMVSKVINGMTVTDSSEIKFLLIPYKVSDMHINLDGLNKEGANIIVDYYQPYEVVITLDAEYSRGYGQWLDTYHAHENIAKQLEIISLQIRQNIANFSVIKQGTSVSRTALLYPGCTQYSGDLWINLDTSDFTLTVKFIRTEVSDFIWADIGIDYTVAGVSVVPHQVGKYLFSDYFSVTVYTNSTEDTPDPITSVEEFKKMEAGINYILMADLYLAQWEPMNADFKSLDGNGYVITLVSFANVSDIKLYSNEYGYNIGIFNQISKDTTIKNLTIEINPSPAELDFTQDKDYDQVINEGISNDYTIPSSETTHGNEYVNSLNVDISSLRTQTNFGVLAGTNLGTVTNVSIINNATALRELREAELAKITANRISLLNADNFNSAISKFSKIGSTDTIKVSYMFENKDEATSRSNKISLLVGTNVGFITNSNVENVSIVGEDYVAGFVGQNIGKISSSYFKGGNIIGDSTTKSNSGNGGLVAINGGEIYYSYVEGKTEAYNIINNNPSLAGVTFSDGDYSGSGIITNSYAGGFVYRNSGKINNCYAKILVSGIYASGFVFECNTGNSIIEYCYAMSNIQANATTNTPFMKRDKLNGASIKECYYLYDNTISNLAEDVAESVAKKEFNQYATFASYAFNTDYYANADILDAVWFIPDGEYSKVTKKYFKNESYPKDSPQLVSANQRTLSIRYMSGAEEESSAYTYSWVPSFTAGFEEVSILRGSVVNPLTINSASGFNMSVVDGTDNRRFRLINDISFTVDDEVATTYSSTFTGKLDGNGMKIENLRISADEVKDENITKLGLFKEIKGSIVRTGGKVVPTSIGEESKYAVVKNLNIEVSQINGMTINMVGVLAGEITDAKIYNVSITGEDYTVQGLNAVGAIAGRVVGDTDMVNISSNVSIKSNYFYQYNAFSRNLANTEAIQKFHTYMNYSNESHDNQNLKYVSYAGGIVGIVDVDQFEKEGVDTLIKNIRDEMYRLRRLSTTGNITIEGEVVGGLFGYLSESSNVSDCDLVVTDNMALKGSRAVGGFVGHNEGDVKNCTVVNYNQDSIDEDLEKDIIGKTPKYDNATENYDIGAQNLFQGNAMFIGGIAGMNFAGKIEKTYNRVNVACENSLYAGGIVGLSIKGEYSDIYVTGSVYGFSAIGGMIGIAISPTDVAELNESKELGFFMTDDNPSDGITPISDMPAKAISINADVTITSSITNVILSNIWKYSHLNVIRSTMAKPNAQPAKIGMLVGYVYGMPTIVEEKDESNLLLAENHVNNVLGAYKIFTDRVITDNIYYKQTYTYQSLKSKVKMTIREIGNQDDGVLLNIFGIQTFDNQNPEPDTTSGRASVYDGNDSLDLSKTNYITFINNDTRYISGKYRSDISDRYDETNDGENGYKEQSYYVFSRMTSYGSIRTLSEIYQRKYNYAEANKLYESLGSAYNVYRENVENISDISYKDSSNTTQSGGIGRYKYLSMYSNWDSSKWYGVGLTLEGNRAEDEYLYPEYKNATVDTGSRFIYTFNQLKEVLGGGDAVTQEELAEEYVLMNDIYWDSSVAWKPIGTKGNAFRGIFRSAKIGDVDGTNVVTENRTFTIFNVNFSNSSVDSTYIEGASGDSTGGSLGIFGYAERATFQNINIHTTGINTTGKEYEYVGTLVGCATEFCTFSNITLFGSSTPFTGIEGSKDSWGAGVEDLVISSDGLSKVKVANSLYYRTYENILGGLSGSATIKTTATAFVGGLVGYAGKSTFGSDVESYYVDNGSYFEMKQVRSSAISAFGITLDVSGNGSQSGYHHYAGGLFGFISIINPSEISSLSNYSTTNSYKYFSTNISRVSVAANLNSGNVSTTTLQQSGSNQGAYVGAYAGYINTNGLTLNGVRMHIVSVSAALNSAKLTSGTQAAIGGLFGFASEVNLNNLIVVDDGAVANDKLELTVNNDKYSQIGGIVGHGERLRLENVVINNNITITITNSDSSTDKYYGGIVGNLLISSVNNLVAKSSITLSISASKYYSGGLAGRITFAGQTISKVVLNNVVQKTGNSTNAGGLAGLVEEAGTITQCYVGGDIESTTASNIGGLVGTLITKTEGNALAQITESLSNVNIISKVLSVRGVAIGGIVGSAGYVASGTMTTTVTPIKMNSVYNSGNILVIYNNTISTDENLPKLMVGGILGYGTLNVFSNKVVNIGTISLSYNNSSNNEIYKLIEANNNSTANIGGVVGKYINDDLTKGLLANAKYNKDLVELTNQYGTGLTTSEMLASIYADDIELSWISSYLDSSWFVELDVTSFVQELQAEGTKTRPKVITETLTQSIINENAAIDFRGSGVSASGLNLTNKSVYFNNAVMTSNPKFNSIDNMSFVYGLKLNLSSVNDYVVKSNQGYLVNWDIKTGNYNIVGNNIGVIIDWTVEIGSVSNDKYIIANNYSQGRTGIILFSKFTIDCNSSDSKDKAIFRSSNASYVAQSTAITNSVVQCQITYINSTINDAHFNTNLNKTIFNNCIKEAYKQDGLYMNPYYIDKTNVATKIGTYASAINEYNINLLYSSANYDFANVYTWLDSTKPVTLQVLEKDHFNDKALSGKNWKDYVKGMTPITPASGVVEVSTRDALVYALYEYAKRPITIKYTGDAVVDLAGKLWTPIDEFTATLDMGGAVIDNVMIIDNSTQLGFVKTLNGGTIKDVTFRNINIISLNTSVTHIGSIAGVIKANAVLSRVGVEGFTVYEKAAGVVTGAIAGKIEGVEGKSSPQINDAYVAVEYVGGTSVYSGTEVYPLAKDITIVSSQKVVLNNYYAYAYCNNVIQEVPFKTMSFENSKVDTSNGNAVILDDLSVEYDYAYFIGVKAEEKLPYFDFINDWTSSGSNGGTAASNFGLPRFNTKKLTRWEDVVDLSEYTHTETSTIHINNEIEFAQFAKWINTTETGKNFTGTAILVNDIDLSKLPAAARAMAVNENNAMLWTPIGVDNDHAFKGTFEGYNTQGSTIVGLSSAGTNVAGLFGYTNGATIRNLTFTGYNGNASSTINERVGARISIEPSVGQIGYAGVVAGYAKNSTIQDITISAYNATGSKYYRSYVKLNNKEKAYLGGVVGCAVGSILFNNKVEGCLYDGDASTASDKTMLSIETKFEGGKPVAMGGIVGAIIESSGTGARQGYAMSNVVKDVNIVNKSNMKNYDYGEGVTTLKLYNQIYSGTNRSEVFFGTGGIAGMSRNSRLVSNNVQTFFTASSNSNALGGIVGQLYGGTVQESVTTVVGNDYSIASVSGYKGLVIGYAARAEAVNLYSVTTDSSVQIAGGSYTPTNADSNTMSTEQIEQEQLNNNWYDDGTNKYKLSDTFRLYNYSVIRTNLAESGSANITSYDMFGDQVTKSVIKTAKTGETKNIDEHANAAWYTGNISFSLKTGETTSKTYCIQGVDVFIINHESIDQEGYFAVNSDYYTKAVTVKTVKEDALLFNWSSPGDILLGDPHYRETAAGSNVYVSRLDEHKHFSAWLNSLLAFRPNAKEIAFNLNLDFDDVGPIYNGVGTKELPFGSRTRLTTISGNNINLEIDRSSENNVGLFGYGINLSFKNIENISGYVKGKYRVGALIGYADNMLLNADGVPQMIDYSSITDAEVDVTGHAVVGGLVGEGYFINMDNVEISSNTVKSTAAVDLATYYTDETYGLSSQYGFNSSAEKSRSVIYIKADNTLASLALSESFALFKYLQWSSKYWATMTGGIIGLARYNVVANNVVIADTSKVESTVVNGGHVGGLIGNHDSVTINSMKEGYLQMNRSKFEGVINASNSSGYKAGLIGYTASASNAFTGNTTYSKISYCQAGVEGTTTTINGTAKIAGITPQFEGAIENTTNYYNVFDKGSQYYSTSGTISQIHGGVAGIVAVMNGEIKYCTNYGSVTGHNKFTAGIVGYLTGGINNSVNNGTITNDGNVGTNTYVVGGIVAYISLNDVTINGTQNVLREVYKCTNNGAISSLSENSNSYVGGIAGYITKGVKVGLSTDIIDDKYETTGNTNTANIYSKGNAGGIVGYASNNTTNKLAGEATQQVADTEICYNKSEIGKVSGYDGDSQLGDNIGGIIGKFDSVMGGLINNNQNLSDVGTYGQESYVGGIVGYMTCGSLKGNINEGEINGYNYVGGIAGIVNIGDIVATVEPFTIEITDNSNTGDITGYEFVGGTIGCLDNNEESCTVQVANNENIGGVAGNNEDNMDDLIGYCDGANIVIDGELWGEPEVEEPIDPPADPEEEEPIDPPADPAE